MGMTEQEAIKFLKKHKPSKKHGDLSDLGYNFKDAYDMSIKALEKQIPKKPNIEGDGYADGHLVYDTWICPNCEKDYEIDYEDYDYCPNCGQKIDKSVFDWGNEDDYM
jgi:rubrerythrin